MGQEDDFRIHNGALSLSKAKPCENAKKNASPDSATPHRDNAAPRLKSVLVIDRDSGRAGAEVKVVDGLAIRARRSRRAVHKMEYASRRVSYFAHCFDRL